MLLDKACHLRIGWSDAHQRSAHTKEIVSLSRYAHFGRLLIESDHGAIRRSQRIWQHINWEEVHKGAVGKVLLLSSCFQFRTLLALTNQQDLHIVIILHAFCYIHKHIHAMSIAHIARIHHDELVLQLMFLDERILRLRNWFELFRY